MMNLFVPSSLTVADGGTQLVALRFEFCCKFQPDEGDGQKMTAVLVVERNILSSGAPGVGTANTCQNPPVREKFPPVIGPPASC